MRVRVELVCSRRLALLVFLGSNHPPAEPGAFIREPLEAAGWGR